MTDKKDEIAELRAEVAALKAALSGKEDKPPPKKEFVPQPYEPIDWTARMSMPRSAIEAMVAAEPRGFMAGVFGARPSRSATSRMKPLGSPSTSACTALGGIHVLALRSRMA